MKKQHLYFAIKKEIDLFSTALDFGDVLTKLKGVFENKSVTKITNSSKTDKKILKKYGIKLENFFDIDIARYVLFAGLPKLPNPEVADYINLKTELEKQMQDEKVVTLKMKVSRLMRQNLMFSQKNIKKS